MDGYLDETTIRTTTSDSLIYYGFDVILTAADSPWQPQDNASRTLPSTRSWVVAGDTVTIRGMLRNPGKDIRIFARQVVFEPDGVLDVSGVDPDPTRDYQPGQLPQQTDTSPGAKGADGNPGGPGAAAGNIVISAETVTADDGLRLIARGGRGGRGQDGHKGNQGAQGSAGTDVLSEDPTPDPPATLGQKGGQGGAGGRPGAPGAGGSGGQVLINFMSYSPSAHSCDVNGGPGGGAADGGQGGDGGEGGASSVWHLRIGNMSGGEMAWPMAAPANGSKGDPGIRWAGTDSGFPGLSGATGAVSWNGACPPGMPDYARLTRFAVTPQLLITQHAASTAYLNAGSQASYTQSAILFIWLAQITAATVADGFAPPAAWMNSDTATAKAIHGFAQAMLARLRSGLDFYGHPKEWVPVVTLAAYVERLQQIIAQGKIIEDQYNAFVSQSASQDERIASLRKTRSALAGDLDKTAAEITALTDRDHGTIPQTDKLIADLTDQIQKQQNLIALDEAIFTTAFKKYVADQAQCSFDQVLQILGAVVAIGASALDGVGALTAAGEVEEAAKAAEGLFNQAERSIKTMKTVLSSIEDIKNNIDTLKGMFPADPGQKDIALLVTDKKKFDTFIDQYVDAFGAAQQLKDAVDDYFAMTDARNQAILTYAAQFTQAAQLQAQYDHTEAQLEAVSPDAKDPTLETSLSFMRAAYTGVKADLTSRLFEAYRAKAYWTLEDEAFSGNDLNIAELAKTFEDLLDKIDSDRLRQGGPLSTFEGIRVSIRAEDYPLAFKALPDSKKLVFQITPLLPDDKSGRNDAFSNQYQVLVNRFTLALPDIKATTGTLACSLDHSGREVQVGNKGGQVFVAPFVHQPRSIFLKIDYGNPSAKVGGDIGDTYFYGLSPFAVWTLDFNFPHNDWVDLSTIRSVDLTMSGNFVAPH